MSERTWERAGAAAGLAFVILILAGTFFYPQPPRVDSPGATTAAWAHDNRVGIQLGLVLGLLGIAAFVWFVGHLRHLLDKSESGAEALSPVVFGSGMVLAAVYALGGVPIALLTFMDGQPGGVGGDVARLLGDMTQVLFAPANAITIVFLGAFGLAMIRHELLAPWLGWVSVVVAGLNVFGLVTSLTFSSYHAGAWLAIGWAAYVGFVAVILIASVSMLREPERGLVIQPAFKIA